MANAAQISSGTGFFYNDSGHLFTNAHVIAPCTPGTIMVRTYDQAWHRARVLAKDASFDLAALSIDQKVPAFASFRLFPGSKSVSVPEEIEDAFYAGFSNPKANDFTIQRKWGQIQPWRDPNAFPFVNRMRMDAYPGASGSAVFDYAGLLIGIVFAGSVDPITSYDKMKATGYGDKWIYAYNNNALVHFANRKKLSYSAWDKWERKDPTLIWQHATRVTVLVNCQVAAPVH
ncbi:serine protease [Cupriavidus sp. UYPR2.512]|uniref:S1 family peptidase n=1 Tax=Cupriavidus sp. UYPR2.512 TaxID=1080187 RepID=UPI0012F7BF00|nr:serine protease [Cupriavidus sp. UYPR2.512]UIF88814.1 trypsin-like peptidase domain-containing protein [Cupriavidus necator]